MSNDLNNQVRELLAGYVDVPVDEFDMDADLDLAYDMDSTELTEFAKTLEVRFDAPATRSQRQDWTTGRHIARFLEAQRGESPNAA